MATVLLQLGVFVQANAQTLQNPIVNANFPDPWIIQHDGWYYWCKQDFGNQITIERFRNLQNMSQTEGWTRAWSADANVREAVWAPELHYINGKWYIFASGDTDGAPGLQNLRMFVLESNTWNGNYTFKGFLNTNSFRPEWAIDPNIFVHPYTSQVYMSWSQWEGGTQCIYIGHLDANNLTHIMSATKLSQPEYGWETQPNNSMVNEGPEFLLKNNKLHIAYSASQCHSRHYKLGLLTADLNSNLVNSGSWSKSSSPVFQEGFGAWGPGHNCFVKSPDYTQDWIVYHAHTGGAWEDTNEHLDRAIFAQQFSWNGDYPVFGAPQTGGPVAAPSTTGALPTGVVPGVYRLVARHSGQVLDVRACSGVDGAKLQQWPWVGGNCQRFNIQPTDNGFFKVTSQMAGQAVDVEGCSSTAGALVQQWPYWGGDCQQWMIEPTSDGYYRFISRKSGQALEVGGAFQNNGANVNQWPWNGATCQQWKLEPVAAYARKGEEEEMLTQETKAYPNPFTDQVSIPVTL
ncbi:MAG: RICIN domain-containing protein, partial [Bacteroidota bacterium]